MRRFITRHAGKITGVLRGFDRLVFRGQLLPLCHEGGVQAFLSSQGALLKVFGKFVEAATGMIRTGSRASPIGSAFPFATWSPVGSARRMLRESSSPDPASLARSYPVLVRHAISDFQSRDVLRFLAKRPSPSYRVEGTTDFKHRVEGIRVKHSAKANSVKMYDKAGSVLRVETTINQPGEFRVRRRARGDPDSEAKMRPLRKGIADFRALAKTGDRSNRAYLDALSAAEPQPTRQASSRNRRTPRSEPIAGSAASRELRVESQELRMPA